MRGKITKIDQTKTSRNGDTIFQRVYFEMEDGSWAVTDLVSSYRNYARWRPVLEKGVGAVCTNLILMGASKVNADSRVQFIGMAEEFSKKEKPQEAEVAAPKENQSQLF